MSRTGYRHCYTRNVLECECGQTFDLGQGDYGQPVGELLVRHCVSVHHREPTRLERTPRKPTGRAVLRENDENIPRNMPPDRRCDGVVSAA